MLAISNFNFFGVYARKLLPAFRFDGFSKFIASVSKPINSRVERKTKIFEFKKVVLIYGPKYHMKYFYHNFEFLHPLVAEQFYRTCLNKSLYHIALPTYARKLVFSFKVAETAHLYLHEKELCHKNVR